MRHRELPARGESAWDKQRAGHICKKTKPNRLRQETHPHARTFPDEFPSLFAPTAPMWSTWLGTAVTTAVTVERYAPGSSLRLSSATLNKIQQPDVLQNKLAASHQKWVCNNRLCCRYLSTTDPDKYPTSTLLVLDSRSSY